LTLAGSANYLGRTGFNNGESRVEILTGEQMRAADRHAIEQLGIPSLDLMEAAGKGIAEALLPIDRPVVVLCGKGNNGGDGLVIARHLAQAGVEVQTIVLAVPLELSPDAATNYTRAAEAGVALGCADDEVLWAERLALVPDGALVVDALLGTGIRGAVRGLIARVIEDINAGGHDVVSVDLPSGLDADTGTVAGAAVRARVTYTLCRPKPALIFEPAAGHAGSWRVIPIGIPDACVEAQGSKLRWQDADDVAGLLRPRARDAHKGKLGHVLVVAGAPGRAGAAVLTARGALRGGAGLVTVACPASIRAEIAVQQAEIMTEPLMESSEGLLSAGAAARAQDLLGNRDTLALGPGLGTDPGTAKAVRLLALSARRAAVIDADGLNALALDHDSVLGLREAAAPRILTPHPGEAARLLGLTARDVQADRLSAVRTLAERTGAVVVLKGDRTLVARPNGTVAVNATGNAGMATAGSGDVLTGVIAAFLARGLDPFDAARLAVFVHGDAGDRAAARRGADGMIASDLLDDLGAAIADRVSGAAR
jgi:NAD(P)H-hydrate epimerase